ncbi:hypothetical protein BDY24DRAFT_440761 [Mrakia frigida]|uniref:uncharacterized protein n=1 Tax=Mrakia frigida TaxID=29902 RepID=UPI003FCBFE17
MLPPRTPPPKLHASPNRSPFYASSLTPPPPPSRAILRSPMGPGDGQSWRGRNRSMTTQEVGKGRRGDGKSNHCDQENTPSSASATTNLLATPALSYTLSPSLYSSSSSYTNTSTTASSTYIPQTPINNLVRRRTRSAFPLATKLHEARTPSPPSSPGSSSVPFDQLAYELSPSFFASESRSAYDGGSDEGAWLMVSEEEREVAARRRRSEGSLMDPRRTKAYSSWEEEEEEEGRSSGTTLTPSTPALPHTPPPNPAYLHPSTPPTQKSKDHPSNEHNQQQSFPTLHFFTPPPPASRRLVPTLPTAPASAPRTRMPRALSPFNELVFEVDEDSEEEEEDEEFFVHERGPLTPERRRNPELSNGSGSGRREVQLGESPSGGSNAGSGGDGSPRSSKVKDQQQQGGGGGGGWKPKLSGLSPSQREARVNASMRGGGMGVGRIVTFGEQHGGGGGGGTTTSATKTATPAPTSMGLGVKVEVEVEVGEREKSCGCCETMVKRNGVKIEPCGCFSCNKCFTSGMNVVCDLVGGVMRCPSCTDPVEAFSPYHPALSKTPSPPHPPSPPNNNLSPKHSPPQHHSSSFFATPAPFGTENDCQPIFLRFDNASWDVTPEMITDFLPDGSLPDSSVNPHPIHLLIDPISGKTKDFFFVEVKSKKAAALIIKTVQGQVLGEGKRARRVTITLSNLMELRREIQPNSSRVLPGLLALCQTAFSTKKSYIKRRSFPFLYLLTLLTRADLRGMETDILLAFQGATLVLSSILESGAATADSISLSNQMVQVVARTSLLAPIVQGPSFFGVVPGPNHPLSRPPPTKPTTSLLFNQQIIDVYNVAAGRGLRI